MQGVVWYSSVSGPRISPSIALESKVDTTAIDFNLGAAILWASANDGAESEVDKMGVISR
ncbi:hypothetical protein [Shewanella aestuarii]|uniref:Uncharacterized protein n=1 Tax=Shewanella aestuarii TaxID=1028752 RepID=A0A6G9QLR6_9GAMM|nr:hypothetical protein [Shewanella aestuarii]QIR14987.1 hypothetical protein HBH39_11265 [Shewanella aestuarii]